MKTIPKNVTLIGKNQHGKNRISEQGDIWKVQFTQKNVLFSKKTGTWLFLTLNHFSRWVHLTRDKNFNVHF